MPLKYQRVVLDHLEKARSAAISAVEAYNRPGAHFRTAQFIILNSIAWTALFHAVFYKRNVKPWYRSNDGKYKEIDGEPKHWELSTCMKKYFKNENPPERKNLEFLIGLRNKIEHRHVPELDPALFGHCQASLFNFEEFITSEFGKEFALIDCLSLAIQFSHIMPEEKEKALKRLASANTEDIRDYVERFQGRLAQEVLSSTKYSFSVYLVPKVVNRANAADLAVEFVNYDPNDPNQADHIKKCMAFIKEKQIPVANLGRFKPGEVVAKVSEKLGEWFTMHVHTCAWKYYQIRPPSSDEHPERTRSEFCMYDELHGDYGYTEAWVKFLIRKLENDQDDEEYNRILSGPAEEDE